MVLTIVIIFKNIVSHKFIQHLMQKYEHTTFLLVVKKINEHEV